MNEHHAKAGISGAVAGDGTYAGARKLYLEQCLKSRLIDRLRAVEGMAATAELLRRAKRKAAQ